jgi:hypothetical protein
MMSPANVIGFDIPAAAFAHHPSTPAPFVHQTWPVVPSAPGTVNVTGVTTLAGARSAT